MGILGVKGRRKLGSNLKVVEKFGDRERLWWCLFFFMCVRGESYVVVYFVYWWWVEIYMLRERYNRLFIGVILLSFCFVLDIRFNIGFMVSERDVVEGNWVY